MSAKGNEHDGSTRLRERELWDNTDFTSTLFGSLIGYAVIAADFDGNVIAYNEGARLIYGYSAEEVSGKRNIESFFPTDFVEAGHLQHAVDVLLATGRFEYEGKKLRKDGQCFDAQVLLTLTKDRSGKVVGFVEIVQDLTERKRAESELRSHRDRLAKANEVLHREIAERQRAERHLDVQHAVTRILAEALSLPQAAPKILEAICAGLGWERAALWSIDADSKMLQRVQVWPTPAEPLEEAPPHSAAAPRVYADSAPSTRALHAPDGRHGPIGFPIHSGTEVLGFIELFGPAERRQNEDLVRVVTGISAQIGQFIERKRAEEVLQAKEQELRVARRIQHLLIPKDAPYTPGFDIHGESLSANETGGDYFDYLPMPQACHGIVIGDASGHGLGPALLITATRAYLRAFAATHNEVGSILSLANGRLTGDVGAENFVTLFLARLDPHARSLTYTSAGHVTGYVLDKAGAVKATLPSTGTPLGLIDEQVFPAQATMLAPGDLVLLLTDGIPEARVNEDDYFGIERALNSVRAHRNESAATIVQTLIGAALDFCENNQLDDITAVVIKCVAS